MMQISTVYIRNFRAISEITVNLYRASSLIGANNSGKSTIFKAIELFFNAGSKVSLDDFHRKDIESPIEIRITFVNITEDERDEFGSAVIDGEMTISREFSFKEPAAPNYSVYARGFPGFSDIRSAGSPSEKLAAYRKLQKEYELESVRSGVDVDEAIFRWEASNDHLLETAPIRGFFGATNVANGKLKKKTSLRLIPAVRDSAEEAKTGKKSPVLELLADITRQTFENKIELQEFLKDAEEKISSLTDPSSIPELMTIGADISRIVQYYYSNSSVVADWEKVEAISVNFPRPRILVKNDEITTDVDFVGHELQRVILFSLIQYMAERAASDLDKTGYDSPKSDIILLIEEPEIYQHPVKQIILYQNFCKIVQKFNTSNGIRFQIIFTTHSEKFVSMQDFEICSIVRKTVLADAPTVNSVGSLRLLDCCLDFASFHEPPKEPMSNEAFASKLHIFSREICEGFFADKLILVEGATDKPVLEAFYESIGRDNKLEGIQVVVVGGESVLQKPAYIFQKIGIPTYLIFDNDDKKSGNDRKQAIDQNRFLQKIMGSTEIEDMPVGCKVLYYAHDGHLESYLKSVIGSGSYEKQFQNLSQDWGIPVADTKKTPAAFSLMISVAVAAGYSFGELNKIVEAVDAM